MPLSDPAPPPLVLLPGLICDARVFADQTRTLDRTIAIDGYGSCASITDMAQHVLDHAPARFDVAGHSMGGRVALEVVRLAPDRVRRIALMSTGTHGVRPGEPEKRRELQDFGDAHGFAALVERWLTPMVAPANRSDALMHRLTAMCLDQGRTRFDHHVAALLGRRDATGQLATLPGPVLVLTGAEDVWSPPVQHEAMAGQLPDAMLTIVANAGHMVTVEAPDAVNAALADWRAA